MSESTYRTAFRNFIETAPNGSQLHDMEDEFYLGSDRQAVIIQASNLEYILEKLITTKLRNPITSDVRRRIFGNNGPISSFSQKILMGYALDLYGRDFNHDLDIIKDLRNGFAHARLPLSLTRPEIAAMCQHLKMADHPNLSWIPRVYSEKYNIDIASDRSHPRTRFTRAVHTISLCMIELEQYLIGNPNGVERKLP